MDKVHLDDLEVDRCKYNYVEIPSSLVLERPKKLDLN